MSLYASHLCECRRFVVFSLVLRLLLLFLGTVVAIDMDIFIFIIFFTCELLLLIKSRRRCLHTTCVCCLINFFLFF